MSLKPTCKEVHRLTSEGLDRELSVMERTRVRQQQQVCEACRNFDNQMRILRRAMREIVPLSVKDRDQ